MLGYNTDNKQENTYIHYVTTSYARDSQFKPSCGHWNL